MRNAAASPVWRAWGPTAGALVILSILAGCAPPTSRRPDWLAVGTRGMVATDSVYASQAGLAILRAGGNAIDAAAAVSFALAVARPESTGLGGGGFLMARFADGRMVVADYREKAPAASSPDLYAKLIAEHPDDPPPSQFGYRAVAVPGVVAGQASLLADHGTLPLSVVVQPAIRLAREGFPVDAHYVHACEEVAEDYARYPALAETCGYVYRVHLRSGNLPRVGDRLVQPALGRLLEQIAEQGADGFYAGDVARSFAQTMNEQAGLIDPDDLSSYRVVYRKPVTTTYRGFDVISMPPPSSGGVCLIEALNILGRRDRTQATHWLVEAMKHAFADRARWLGDPDFASVPVSWLTSKTYAHAMARTVDPAATHDPAAYGADRIPDDRGTSHFCIVDQWGNAVVATETINTSFGSLAAIDDWGLILNNEMDDFAAVAGEPNVYGLKHSARNAVQPGKRPLSSMTPTMVLRDGQPYLLLGGSGGPRIISSVLGVLVQVIDLKMPLEDAVTARRVHHQWWPNEVVFDAPPDPALAEGLRDRGHQISDKRRTGVIQALLIQDGQLIGASDPRKGGRPAGY
jgi:gamma-glutamyltranspeptidase/glutathione hydrolase